jgi:squalene-hopene/tetraprenyl-beta-curcumene cyclase
MSTKITTNSQPSEPDPTTGPSPTVSQRRPVERANDALRSASAHLRGLQTDDGWWKGELQTNITMDAEDLMLRYVLDIFAGEVSVPAARWIRSQQRADGSWANFSGGPGDLSTTVEGWVALRLCGDQPASEHMRRAARFVRAGGGVEASRVFTRIWLALLGLWKWNDLPQLPPELIFLPRWAPLNIYNWGCWARQTIVPLSVICALQPARPVSFDIDVLRIGALSPRPDPLTTVAGRFQWLDQLLHRYHRRPIKSMRTAALHRAAEWILARQEADGSWGGIQPPWVYSILALRVLGYPLDHPSVRAALDGLDGFVISADGAEGPIRRLEACQSPVWDTALALNALLDAGASGDDPDLCRAADWLTGEQIEVGGDWQVRRPEVEPGGWAFEFANDGYPDVDDSAEIVLGLARVCSKYPTVSHRAIHRGANWIIGMQSSDGGWGAFDADNDKALATEVPFSDFGAVIDPPSADVTAHVIEMLAALGDANSRACQRGIAWLFDHQETDGSWFGRWGANHVYGTGAVVPALVAAGLSPAHPRIVTALRWLEDHQNSDGGWGEDLRSYDDRAWVGRGSSTPSQTAWALLALLAGGKRESDTVARGIDWLIENQRADGAWDEDHYTGTGFPGAFYINYHLYRLVFPIWALGRYVNRVDVPAAGHDHQRDGEADGYHIPDRKLRSLGRRGTRAPGRPGRESIERARRYSRQIFRTDGRRRGDRFIPDGQSAHAVSESRQRQFWSSRAEHPSGGVDE